MFPDPTIKWKPYPSVIDGIERGPYVLERGLQDEVLHLIVVHYGSSRAYGIEVLCNIYFGCEEMIYSIAPHGDTSGMYGGDVYIKEGERSALLETFASIDPNRRKPRHFLFVGVDFCYEVLGFADPIVRAFNNLDEAFSWGPSASRLPIR